MFSKNIINVSISYIPILIYLFIILSYTFINEISLDINKHKTMIHNETFIMKHGTQSYSIKK